MTRILKVLAVPATGAGYYEDLAALRPGPVALSERYTAPPVTPGFRAIREVAEAVSVGLVLDDGRVAWGDCVGRTGRDPLFRTEQGVDAIRRLVAPALEAQELAAFRPLAAMVDDLTEPPEATPQVQDSTRRALLAAPWRALREAARPEPDPRVPPPPAPGSRLHTAVRYGVSQALLAAVALARGVTMAEVVAAEWQLPPPATPIPLHARCGHDRIHNAEKMIVRRIASLPHGLVDNLAEQVGQDGGELTRYIHWLKERIAALGGDDYRPTIHLDVHGAVGRIHNQQLGPMLGQLVAWHTAAQPYRLRVESPVLLDDRQAQIDTMVRLRNYVRFRRIQVDLVADRWANSLDGIRAFLVAGAADMVHIKMPDLGSIHNSVEAILACKAAGVGAFLGGSDAETDLAARVAVHVALGAQPDLLMARPGTGVDEAISLAQNEMARTLATIAARPAPIQP